jgi:hypothetical protein
MITHHTTHQQHDLLVMFVIIKLSMSTLISESSDMARYTATLFSTVMLRIVTLELPCALLSAMPLNSALVSPHNDVGPAIVLLRSQMLLNTIVTGKVMLKGAVCSARSISHSAQ